MRNLLKKWSPFFNIATLIITVIATFAYAMFQGGFVSWFLFYSASIVVMITVVYALMPIGQLEVKRAVNAERLVAGDDLRVTITIERKFLFPFLYFIIEDVIPEDWQLKNAPIHSKEILYPAFGKHMIFSYTIRKPKRGEYQFTKVKLRTSDPFGLFMKEKEIDVRTEAVVYPSYEKIDGWNMYNQNEAEAYLTSQRIVEDITSVAGSREYVPGDRLTSIDWKVTARINKLMTKEFEEYLGQRFLVVLDCSINSKEKAVIFEKGVELATSFVVHSYKNHFPLGLLTIGKEVSRYQVHFGEAHQGSMLEHLAKLNFHFANSFDFVFVNEINKITADTVVVVVSTRLTDAMVENLRRLKKKSVTTAFCFVTSNRKPSQKELAKLTTISSMDILNYVIGKDSFEKDLKVGETFAQK